MVAIPIETRTDRQARDARIDALARRAQADEPGALDALLAALRPIIGYWAHRYSHGRRTITPEDCEQEAVIAVLELLRTRNLDDIAPFAGAVYVRLRGRCWARWPAPSSPRGCRATTCRPTGSRARSCARARAGWRRRRCTPPLAGRARRRRCRGRGRRAC